MKDVFLGIEALLVVPDEGTRLWYSVKLPADSCRAQQEMLLLVGVQQQVPQLVGDGKALARRTIPG
jgi:hypothetical protein